MSKIHKHTSSREILGLVHGIGMNINNILGSGIVTTPGIIWKAIKSPWIVLLLWLSGGIVSIAGSLTYVELGAIHKMSGGEAKYLFYAFPKPKFMMSYIFSFINIFAIRPGILCAILQPAAQYFWYTVKGYNYDLNVKQHKDGWHLSFSPFWFIKLTAVAFLFIITLYHMISNKWTNYINQTLTVIKLITYSIIAIAGIVRLFSDWSLSRINWQQSLSGNADITAYSTSILLILFSYDGWNSVNYSLDEYLKPEINLIYSNTISIGIVTALYLFVNVALISVIPSELMDDKIIIATFFHQLFGESKIVRIFTGLVVLSIIGTAASQIWSGSRVIVSVAELRFFPIYSEKLETWNEYFNTPVNALFTQLIWCSIIILFCGNFTIARYTSLSVFSMYSYWIFYLATGIGLLVIRSRNKRRRQQDQENYGSYENSSIVSTEKNNNFKVPTFITGIFILAGLCTLMLAFSFVFDDNRIQKLFPIFISYGFLFIAIILWYFLYYTKCKDEKKDTINFIDSMLYI